MNKKVRWITETAVMLALLVTLQAVSKSLGQLVTGSCVNAVLAIATLLAGMKCGITVALCSPVCAFLLGIAPNFVTVLPIMLANTVYVVLLHLLAGSGKLWQQKAATAAAEGKFFVWRQPVGLAAAAGAKFLVLYLLVVKVICGVASGALLGKKLGQIVVLAPPMLEMLPAMFAWPQLITALIGGAVALLITPVLKKALKK